MGNPDAAQQEKPIDAVGIRAVAAQLSAAGLVTVVQETSAGLDLTATSHQPGRKEVEVVVDEDGYAELRWWADPGATPALAAVTAGPDSARP